MNAQIEIPGHSFQLPIAEMAQLLGISVGEYLKLDHRPLQAYYSPDGKLNEFFIYVSPHNDPKVLNKMLVDKSNFVRFRPEEVYRRC